MRRVVALGGIGACSVAFLSWLILVPKAPKPEPPRQQSRGAAIAYEPPPKPTPVVAQAPLPQPKPFMQTQTQAQPQPQPMQMPAVVKEKRPAVYTFGRGGGNDLPEYMKPKVPAAGEGGPPAASTTIAYKSAALPGAKTTTIRDRNLILMPGLLVCILDTAVNTDVAGPFECHLARDAMSPTGVVLMEKGTAIQGSYASSVTQGQSRIVGVTAFATTPNGVVVPLGAPLADQLGAGGVEGDVNNHWMQRLGGALLLSLIDSAFALAQTELQKAGSTNLNISTGSGVGGLASQLLAKTINIPPTITLPQGTAVGLFSTGFIDFGPSYKLEVAR
jgi:type IV secretion system protein VirB10